MLTLLFSLTKANRKQIAVFNKNQNFMASSKICYAPSLIELQIQSEAYNEILIWLFFENRLGKLLKSIAFNFSMMFSIC